MPDMGGLLLDMDAYSEYICLAGAHVESTENVPAIGGAHPLAPGLPDSECEN